MIDFSEKTIVSVRVYLFHQQFQATVLLMVGLTSRVYCDISNPRKKDTCEPGSKLLVLGMVIQPLIGNPYNGHINPYYWVDDHPLLYGNNGSLDPSTCETHHPSSDAVVHIPTSHIPNG